MAPEPSSNEAVTQGLEYAQSSYDRRVRADNGRLANMADLTMVYVADRKEHFTVHTSLLTKASKWFQEREETVDLVRKAATSSSPERDIILPSTVQIPHPHTLGAVTIFVDYLYQKDVQPYTAAFTKHGIEAYHLSRFLQSTDFERCCERAVEHALSKGTLKPSLSHLHCLREYDASNPVRTYVLDNLAHRFAKGDYGYGYNSNENSVDGSTWKELWQAIAEKNRASQQAVAVDALNNKHGHHNTAKSGELSGQLQQPQSSGGLFGNNQTQQRASNPSFGTTVHTNMTSNGAFGGNAHSTTVFGNNHNPPSTSRGVFGTSQAEPNPSGGIFGNSRPNFNTGGLFGSTSQTQPQSSGGLFGNARPSTTTGGLFGNANQNQSRSSAGLFGSTHLSTTHGGIFGQPQPQSSGSLFGSSRPSVSTGNVFGSATQNQPHYSGSLFGSRPAQSGSANSDFGNKPDHTTPGGFSSSNSHTVPQNSGGLFGANFANNGNRNDSNNGGVFGQNQAQNQSFNSLSNCCPSVSIFSKPNPPSAFGSNVHLGGLGATAVTCGSTYKPTPLQASSSISPFGGFGQRSKESDQNTDHNAHKIGTTIVPFAPFTETEVNGNTCTYNHIACMPPYINFSTEELRLNDYENGVRCGCFQPQRSHNTSDNLTPQLASIPLRKLNPAAEMEQLSRQVALQKAELEALRARVDECEKCNSKGAGNDKETPKIESVTEGKRQVDEMATLMCIFEKKLSIVEKEIDTLKQKQDARDLSLTTSLPTKNSFIFNKHKEVDNEKGNSATSTPVNIFTPTSSAAVSPSPTFDPTTAVVETEEFVNVDSLTESETETPRNTFRFGDTTSFHANDSNSGSNVNTNANDTTDRARDDAPQISATARQILTYLEITYPSPSSGFRLFAPDMHSRVGLQQDEFQEAAVELVVKRMLSFGSDGNCYRRI